MFSFVFWRKLKTPKRHFENSNENIWRLGNSSKKLHLKTHSSVECGLTFMRSKHNVVASAIYFSPVLEQHKYLHIKYLNREKNIFWLTYNNKIIIRSHRYHDAI